MSEYDPADDARKCYELAIEMKRARVEKAGIAANEAFRKFFPGSRMDKETRETVALAVLKSYGVFSE